MNDPAASLREAAPRNAWLARRRGAALAQGAVIALLPLLRAGGEGAVRFDISSLTLHFFGGSFGMEEFHIVLLAALFVLAVAGGAAVILGRAWCGWSCPQTVMPLLARWISSALPRPARRLAEKGALVFLSAFFSFVLICYFLPPAAAARGLVRSWVVFCSFLSLFTFHLFMLLGLGPRFCRSVCPYGMLQNVLFDRDTLVVEYDMARDPSCLQDRLCVHACPVGIDIRRGLTRECIACAQCIDACVRVTAPRGILPFIGYRGRLLRGKTAAWGAAAALLGGAVAWAAAARPALTFAVQWEQAVPGSQVHRYRYAVRNNTATFLDLRLDVEGGSTLMGSRRVAAPPRSRVMGRVLARPARKGEQVTFILSGPGVLERATGAAP